MIICALFQFSGRKRLFKCNNLHRKEASCVSYDLSLYIKLENFMILRHIVCNKSIILKTREALTHENQSAKKNTYLQILYSVAPDATVFLILTFHDVLSDFSLCKFVWINLHIIFPSQRTYSNAMKLIE